MQFINNLPRKTNAFSNYIPTTCKHPAKIEIIEDNVIELENDQTHVLLKHNSDIEGPSKRQDETDSKAPIIKKTSRVISIQTPL